MRILTRYLVRAHVGPFLFALCTLTGLLFLNTVAQRMEDLTGKGLGWEVIGEFLYLSLPHTVALTFPMAVLVAVLYAFSELATHNEITAIKAGGVRPQRMLLPLVATGALVAGFMLFFNDQVLPEANHALKNLMVDINRKSPTFALREQVVNAVPVGNTGDRYYITASTIDNETNEMEEVAIYDSTNPLNHRTTFAERGIMAFNEARTDLYLTLYDGVIYETSKDSPGGFQQVHFERQILPLRGVSNEMERRLGGTERTDREMSIAMLRERAAERRAELDSLRRESVTRNLRTVRRALGLPTSDRPPGEQARDAASAPPPGAGITGGAGIGSGLAQLPRDEGEWRGSALSVDDVSQKAISDAREMHFRAQALTQSINRYEVEVHKKFTLAFACIVFVLVGAPLAIRFPGGGLGMVIAASSAIFSIYWAGLIGGETLADRGIAPPWVTMWMANIIFLVVGLWLFLTMGRETGSGRTGLFDDVLWKAGRFLRRFTGREGPATEGRAAAEGGAAG